jgi:hypothetical protein
MVGHSIPLPRQHPLACMGVWELLGQQEASPRHRHQSLKELTQEPASAASG